MQKLSLAIVIILVVGFACNKAHSQSALRKDSTIKDMLDELRQLKESNLHKAFEFSKQIEQRAAKTSYQQGVWEARIERGIIYDALGNADSSISMVNQVLKETRDLHDRLSEIKAHLGLARIYQHDFKLQPGVDQLIQAEKLLESKDPLDLRFDILNLRGNIHRSMKDFGSALKYYKIIEDRYFKQLSSKQKFFVLMNQGNVFADQKAYDKTEELFKKAYEEIKKVDSPDNLALITYNLGALFYRLQRYEEAQEYITQALDTNNKIGDRTKIERCYRVLGAICYDRKEYAQAEKYYRTALDIALSIKNANAIMGDYKSLYLTYWDRGYHTNNIKDLDKALNYYEKYDKIKDSLYQIETTAKVLELEKQYESEKKNNQIALLEKENQHQMDQILMERTRRNYMILSIILVSILLGVFVYFAYYYKRINRLLKVQRKNILMQKNQIYEQNTQLQKLINTQNRLFRIIAHDLRSPLVSLFNISNLIEYHIEDKEYEALEKTAIKMNQKITKILGLTDNLLIWAHSQSKSSEVSLMPISSMEIVKECLEIYRPIAADKNIKIDYSEPKDLMVWADSNMLRTVFRNLINNAIKFTHPNGNIKIWQESSNGFVRFTVKDSGVGIDKDKLETLFEISHEKISADTSGEKSSGLGLSICREFVQAMKGRIWVESQVGAGSRFTFELLVYDPQSHPVKSPEEQKLHIAAPVEV